MKRVRTFLFALALAFVGVGTIYALTVENSSSTEQIKVRRQCRTCKGTGKVEERILHAPCSGYGCRACDYKGYSTYTVDCSTCGGSGWINVK